MKLLGFLLQIKYACQTREGCLRMAVAPFVRQDTFPSHCSGKQHTKVEGKNSKLLSYYDICILLFKMSEKLVFVEMSFDNVSIFGGS